MNKKPSFTLFEVIIVIAILAILMTISIRVLNPPQQIERAEYIRALSELSSIGKAIQFFASDNGYFPADVVRNIPPGIEDYITAQSEWPQGPLPGSVYDYDNWLDKTCIDAEASGSIQITLRQVPDRNPDGSDVWAWYYVLQGKGTPHCDSSSEWNKGECVNCPGFEI